MIKPYTFTNPANYVEYVNRTNEKLLLQELLETAYYSGALPIKIGDKNKKILDLGSGLGTHTKFLTDLFKDHEIYALDVSKDFMKFAKEDNKNSSGIIIWENQAFEDYSKMDFDFILASHVLQYIKTPLRQFIKKIIQSLNRNGEAWIVLQEELGLNLFVTTGREYLDSLPIAFSTWFTHNTVRTLLEEENVKIRTEVMHSYFSKVDFSTLNVHDQHFLNFILLDNFQKSNEYLINSLEKAQHILLYNNSCIHNVGISKIRRI